MKIHITTFDKLKGQSATSYCRKLLKKGANSEDSLEIYRFDEEGRYKLTPDLTISNIGKAAELTVVDDGRGNVRHAKYNPPSWDRKPQEGHGA